MGLDDTYSTVNSQILSVDPFSNLGRAYPIAAQEEKYRSVVANHIATIEATALLIREGESRQRKVEDGKNQKEPNALAGTTLPATIEEAMSSIPGLTHAPHQQLLLLLSNNGASTVVSTSTSPLPVTSPSSYASSSHDSSAINPSTTSDSIDSTVLVLGKRS
ncbi:hypothetical protein H5410_027990 [Solanum commersonii]|uniref:Uncharacterized protein n=1 Tax=Solanum commersonii TaxID=4109 RepID=A0A9J5Z1D9_SOLCO|nr:hypothetical protein H5410_027990 [Solanum commersonii]